jgi:hypothetical protein
MPPGPDSGILTPPIPRSLNRESIVNWFWHALWISLLVIPTTLLWISCVVSIFIRDNLSLPGKILWLLAIFVLPIIGSLAYIALSPSLWHSTDTATIEGNAPGYSRPSRDGAPPRSQTSLAAEMQTISSLHAGGDLTDAEFAAAKAQLLQPASKKPDEISLVSGG